jgi:uncharacterized membrane protein YdjX (TVP38/TMEM64 family)
MTESGAEAQQATPESTRRAAPVARILLGLAAIGALYFLGRHAGAYLPRFAEWVDGLGAWGPAVFIAGYAVAVVGLVSGLLLTLAGGAIFGIVEGTAYVFVGATLGAAAAFLVARYAARSWVERRVEGNPRFAAVDRAVGRDGRRIVLLLRLVPFFPFVLLNYALGLTRVRFADYLIASVGMLPATVLYVYYGRLLGEVAALAGGVELERGAADYAVLGLGLAAAIAVTAVVTRVARRALDEATGLDGMPRP